MLCILILISSCKPNIPIEQEEVEDIIEIPANSDIYYFRVYRSDTNETLDEFWASDISIGIQQMDMSRRYYIQNTPNVKTEYYLSELPN